MRISLNFSKPLRWALANSNQREKRITEITTDTVSEHENQDKKNLNSIYPAKKIQIPKTYYQAHILLIASDNSDELVLSIQHVSTQANSNPSAAAISQHFLIFSYPFFVVTDADADADDWEFEEPCISWKDTSSSSHVWERIA